MATVAKISALTAIADTLRSKSYTTSYTLKMTGKTIADNVSKCIMSPQLLKKLVEGLTTLDKTNCLDFTCLNSTLTRGNTMLTQVDLAGSYICSIAAQQFLGCTGLTEVTLGERTTQIGHAAFWECTALTSITCLAADPPSLEAGYIFPDNLTAIYVPKQSVNSYKADSGWSEYADLIQGAS